MNRVRGYSLKQSVILTFRVLFVLVASEALIQYVLQFLPVAGRWAVVLDPLIMALVAGGILFYLVSPLFGSSFQVFKREALDVSGVIEGQEKEREQLEAQRHYLEKSQEIGNTGTWTHDPRTNTGTWTRQLYRIFDLPDGSAVDYERYLSFVHPDDRESVDREWKAALAGKPSYSQEYRIVVNGEVKWLRAKAELTFDEDMQCTSVVGFTQDITARREADALLASSEKRYRELYENSPLGYLSL
ncbi:MAG: PAS domain-containing protein, partial [Lysobacterales bacterium]